MARWRIPVSVLCLLPACCLGQQMSSARVADIIRRSSQVTQADWKRAPAYDFCETDKTKSGSRTFAVLMIDGSPYNRLVQVNGKDLSADQEATARRKLKSVEQRRKNESGAQRAKRVAQYEKERHRDQELLKQLAGAMTFKFVGTDTIDSRPVNVFEATPRPGYTPTSMETQVLKAAKGKLWIDQATFHWAKVEAQVVKPVSVVGFLARVEPGTRFELEESPVSSDLWLQQHFAMAARAKIALMINKSSQADEHYFHYEPNGSLSVDACREKAAGTGP